jgi:hypothetical protein
MDYGNGQFDGVVQYNPVNKPEVCRFLTGMKNQNCAHFSSAQQNSACGDGLLGINEQCECLDGSTQCGSCQQCTISANRVVECSSSQFVHRSAGMENKVLVVQPSLLKDPKCCPNNRFAGPKVNCGPGQLDACGPNGNCIRLCTRWMLHDNPNCGFDSSG